jgi:hypothetical protein
MVKRAIAMASARAGRYVIPSDVAGNGVEIDADTAAALGWQWNS